MIHDVKFSEWTLKALRDLPVCAEEYDDKELEDEDWWNNLYRCSSSSLLNGDASVMVLDSQLQFACLGPISLWNLPLFFRFCVFPCSFQQVYLVCLCLLQWSHLIFPLPHAFFEIPWLPALAAALAAASIATSAEFSWMIEEEPPIMTDLWLSSFRTSTNTSWIEGKGSLPRTHLRTSSNSLFNPARELNTRSFSIILKQALSAAHAHSNP